MCPENKFYNRFDIGRIWKTWGHLGSIGVTGSIKVKQQNQDDVLIMCVRLTHLRINLSIGRDCNQIYDEVQPLPPNNLSDCICQTM